MTSKTLNKTLDELNQNRGVLRSRDGGWIIGRGVFSHGENIMQDMLINNAYFRIFILNATGYMPDERFCRWLEAAFIGMSWPDPRIWCNMIGSLGATARVSSMGSTLAGMIASDSTLYSARTIFSSMKFITTCVEQMQAGVELEDILQSYKKAKNVLRIPGYARPIADGDMRVALMLEVGEALGFKVGEHLKMGLKVDAYIDEKYSQSMNFGGYLAAFLADTDYSAEQAYRLFAVITNSGITACYADDIEKPAGNFLPLQCNDIDYQGAESRPLPTGFNEK